MAAHPTGGLWGVYILHGRASERVPAVQDECVSRRELC